MDDLSRHEIRLTFRLIKEVWLGKTPAVKGLSGMAGFGRIVPIKDLIVMLGMYMAYLVVVTGPPDVLINPKGALPAFIDQPGE